MVYDVWCMIRTQVYLPEDLKLQLREYADNKSIPISEVVRKAVLKEINKGKRTAGDSLARIAAMAVKGGPKDLSSNLFDYLYGEKSDYAKNKRETAK